MKCDANVRSESLRRIRRADETRPLSWIVPIIILVLLAVLALFTLPKAPS